MAERKLTFAKSLLLATVAFVLAPVAATAQEPAAQSAVIKIEQLDTRVNSLQPLNSGDDEGDDEASGHKPGAASSTWGPSRASAAPHSGQHQDPSQMDDPDLDNLDSARTENADSTDAGKLNPDRAHELSSSHELSSPGEPDNKTTGIHASITGAKPHPATSEREETEMEETDSTLQSPFSDIFSGTKALPSFGDAIHSPFTPDSKSPREARRSRAKSKQAKQSSSALFANSSGKSGLAADGALQKSSTLGRSGLQDGGSATTHTLELQP